jgi:hypothetical protein
MENLLRPDPKARLKIDEIKKHPFFKGIDWANIRKLKAPIIPKYNSKKDTSNFEKGNRVLEEKEKLDPFFEDNQNKDKSRNSIPLKSNSAFSKFDLSRLDLLAQLNQQDAAIYE